MRIKHPHLDANESAFFDRQLNVVRSKVYEARYPEIVARRLIPLATDIPSGAATWTYFFYDVVGYAKIVANMADDLPRVDLTGKPFTAVIRSAGDAYGYSIVDVRSAAQAGVPLKDNKAKAAKRAALQLEQDVAFLGDSDYNLVGLFNHPNITDVAIPADGTGSTSTWSTKTAALIYRDMQLVTDSIFTTTKGIERANTLLLPRTLLSLAQGTLYSSTTTSALDMFKKNNPDVVVEVLEDLAAAGAGGTPMMLAYRRSPDVLELITPQDFEQLDEQPRNLEFVVPCHMRIGGIAVYLPLAIAKADAL